MHRFLAALVWAGVVAHAHAAPTGGASPSFPAADLEFFELRVRPVLAENCYACHSAASEKLKAGLKLDSRADVLKGGESGPAAIAGDPENSVLIKAVRYTDRDLQMPPRKGKLPDQRVADLIEWVRRGLPWPEEALAKGAPIKHGFEITAQDRDYWAFRPIHHVPLPAVQNRDWIINGIDAFVLAGLEGKGLRPNPRALPRELVRRAYFDLIGLPPAPEEVAAFERDPSRAAYEQLVDRLLARPEYGERWARHWLDVVRYAQSNGYERDGEKPLAWRYRDYVVKALNQDKPFTRFIIEQIAGDELPDASADSVTATGFQRLGVWDDEPDDMTMAEFDGLDDIVSTTSTAFLGLTLGCARCHDHKFDPISQADYYQFLSFFRNVMPNAEARYALDSANYVPLAPPREVRAWQGQREGQIQALESQAACAADAGEKATLAAQLDKLKKTKPPFEWALAVRERSATPPPTHVLIRGNPASPGPEVQPAFLSVLGGAKPHIEPSCSGSVSTGRRLALGRWIASADNPLTARVAVNRAWHHHFGEGIVKTTGDFGRAGLPPTNPELLDWLAADFIESGWSLKQLHRRILLSNTYQMSSAAENAPALAADPADHLLWRQRLRRLEAESVWDAILKVSGELNPEMGGRGFFPHLNGEVLAGESRPGMDWEISPRSELVRRSLYIYIRRTMLVPLLEAFDYNNTSSPLAERPVTTVAPQALMLLNADWIQERASAFAQRLAAEHEPNARIRRGYELALGRAPRPDEIDTALRFLQTQASAFQKIAPRVTFRPDVPNSLFGQYMDQLRPTEYLRGPTVGWTYDRGRWSGAYEGIRAVDRQRGPFALWTGCNFQDGTVEARVLLHRSAESASLLLRSKVEDHEQRGYELVLDPRQQRVVWRQHGKTVVVIGEASAPIPTGIPVGVRIALDGPRVQVWIQKDAAAFRGSDLPGGPSDSSVVAGPPQLDVTDANPIQERGYLGVRAAGAALSIDSLVLQTGSEQIDITRLTNRSNYPSEHPAGDKNDDRFGPQAWQSFCLLLLNLNEFVYVD